MSQLECTAAQLLTTPSSGCDPGDGHSAMPWPFPMTPFLQPLSTDKQMKESCVKWRAGSIRGGGQENSEVYHFYLFSLLLTADRWLFLSAPEAWKGRLPAGFWRAAGFLRRCRWGRDTEVCGAWRRSQSFVLPLASCGRAPLSSGVQTAGWGKTLFQCAKTGGLRLARFPLTPPHSLQLSDFHQGQFPPHVQPSIFRRPWMSVAQHGACSS